MLLLSLVTFLVAASPSFALTVPNGAGAAELNARSSPAVGLDKRDMQRQVAARIALAKARAARNAKRLAVADDESNGLVRREMDDAYDAVGVSRRDQGPGASLLVKRAQPVIKCSVKDFGGNQKKADAYCIKFYKGRVSYPTTAEVSCNGYCSIRCTSAYTQLDYSTSVTCIKNVGQCGGVKCVRDPNGVTGCVKDRCTLTCTTRGYTLNKKGNICLATLTDDRNCGKEGNKCPRSYDGKYGPLCVNGACTLDCPPGYTPGLTKTGKKATCVRK